MSKPAKIKDVWGRMIPLSNDRLVFVGRHADYPDRAMIAFQSEEGEQTFLALSNEALAALAELQANPQAGLPECTFPEKCVSKKVWRWKVSVPTGSPTP